jgi:effector-binding domain-containing protein
MTEPIELVWVRPQRVATVRRTVSRDNLGAFFAGIYLRIGNALTAAGSATAGPPFARYYNSDPSGFDVQAGWPFEGRFAGAGDINVDELPECRAARTVHIGRYDGLSAEYRRIEAWLAENGHRPRPGPWESYLDSKEAESEDTRTELFWPLA